MEGVGDVSIHIRMGIKCHIETNEILLQSVSNQSGQHFDNSKSNVLLSSCRPQHNTVQHSTTQHSAAQHNTVQHSAT